MCSKEFWVLNLLGYEEFGLYMVFSNVQEKCKEKKQQVSFEIK